MFKPVQEHVFRNKKQRQLLGDKLALARLLKGFSQADALRMCGMLLPGSEDQAQEGGVTRGFLSYVEAGIRGVTKDQLQALAKLYGVSVKHFTDETELDEHQKRMLSTLRAGMRHQLKGPRKQKGLVGRPRKVVALGQATVPVQPKAIPTEPKPGPAITSGDIAILDAIRDCSEPEKVWLRDAIIKLKARMRPTAVAAY